MKLEYGGNYFERNKLDCFNTIITRKVLIKLRKVKRLIDTQYCVYE